LTPILWQPPQPFWPSIIAIGCQCAVGIALTEAQAAACLPFLYWATRSSWQVAQVSGVGIFASAASAAEVCSSPWQAEQSTSAPACFESFQSATTPGVVSAWQPTQVAGVVVEAGAGSAASTGATASRVSRETRDVGVSFIGTPFGIPFRLTRT
jgi:hypothetical protein